MHDLHQWAKEHAASNPDMFEVLPLDPDTYEHQRLHKHTVDGSPLDPAIIDTVAADIDERYPQIVAAVEQQQRALRVTGEILDSRQNVVLGTDHGELTDIALMMTAIKTQLHRQGYEFNTGMIHNKMLAFLGVKLKDGLVPATELLAMVMDEQYLNIPMSASSRKKMSVPRRVITHYNSLLMEHGIERRLKASQDIGKAMLMGVALSATINKPLDTEAYAAGTPTVVIPAEQLERAMVIGRANKGITRFTQHGLTICASANLAAKPVRIKIADEPLSVRTPDKLETAMRTIAGFQSQNDPHHFYVYDKEGDLPVVVQPLRTKG